MAAFALDNAAKLAEEASAAVSLLRINTRPPAWPLMLFANPALQMALARRNATSLWDEHRPIRLAPELREFAPRGYDADSDDGSNPRKRRPSVYAFKLSALALTEYDRTVYLDLDVFVLNPSLVNVLLTSTLRVADVAMPGPVPGRFAMASGEKGAARENALGVPVLCSCLIAYRKTAGVLAWMIDAARALMQRRNPELRRQGDQEYLWFMWWSVHASKGSLRVLGLPDEWYCPWRTPRVARQPGEAC